MFLYQEHISGRGLRSFQFLSSQRLEHIVGMSDVFENMPMRGRFCKGQARHN